MPWLHVYILHSLKDGRFYIGYTADLQQRLLRHNRGEVLSTRFRRPFELIFYESFLNAQDAKRRERYFKTTKGKTTLKQMLRRFLETDKNKTCRGSSVG